MDEPSFFTYLTEEDAPKILFVGWPYGLVRVFLYFIIVLEMILIIYVVLWFRRYVLHLVNLIILYKVYRILLRSNH